jgi:hypothetical protein
MEDAMAESAFPSHFEARLAKGKYTRWAVGLPLDSLEALLWMIGEYGFRSGGLPSDALPGESIYGTRAHEALRAIAAIANGDRFDVEEARHRIRQAVADRIRQAVAGRRPEEKTNE